VLVDSLLIHREELFVFGRFNVDEQVVCTRCRPNQLVKLQLRGGLLAALGVLDHEHHDKRDR
jgi:hypothetical protein